MNIYIGAFIMNFRKPNGEEYEPDTLTSFHRGIARKLDHILHGHDIIRSPVFKTSRKVLKMRRRELKQLGKGNKPNRADPLSEEQESLLWESGQLGLHNAESVQNTVWYFIITL